MAKGKKIEKEGGEEEGHREEGDSEGEANGGRGRGIDKRCDPRRSVSPDERGER